MPTINDLIADARGYGHTTECAYAIWLPEDVKRQAEDMDITLTNDEIKQVLKYIHRKQDCTIGINWSFLEYAINAVIDKEE